MSDRIRKLYVPLLCEKVDYFRYSDIILYGSVYIYGEKITFTSLNYEGYRAVDVYNGIECSTWNRASKF